MAPLGFQFLCVATASALPDAREAWVALHTRHFVLYANATRDQALRVAQELERFRAFLDGGRPAGDEPAALPTTVILFSDASSFAPYKRNPDRSVRSVSGSFTSALAGNYVAMDANPYSNPYHTVFHEYVHDLAARRYGRIPLWLNEGMAEFYSTFHPVDEWVELGRPPVEHVGILRSQTLLPLADLFAVDSHSKIYNERDGQGLFYAESWVLYHYLAVGSPERKGQLQRFLTLLQEGKAPADACQGAFAADYAQIERELDAYVHQPGLGFVRAPAESLAVDTSVRVESMRRPDVLCTLGDYLAQVATWESLAAEAHFKTAIDDDSLNAPAWAGLGFVRLTQHRYPESEVFFRQALDLDGSDAKTCFLFGRCLLDRFLSEASGQIEPLDSLPAPIRVARESLRRSLALEPRNAEAYVALGKTYLFERRLDHQGIDVLEAARKMLPSRMDVVYDLVCLHLRIGERETAMRLIEGTLATANEPEIETLAREALRVDTYNRQVDLYDQAVAKANKQDYSGAAALLERLLGDGADPKIEPSARELLTRVRSRGIRRQPSTAR